MITQDWFVINQATSLPQAIISHERYATGKWSFDSAKAKYSVHCFMQEIVITFREIVKDGSTFSVIGLIDHWKKDSDDILDSKWTLERTTIS